MMLVAGFKGEDDDTYRIILVYEKAMIRNSNSTIFTVATGYFGNQKTAKQQQSIKGIYERSLLITNENDWHTRLEER